MKGRRKAGNELVRSLTRAAGGTSYSLTLPIDVVRKFGWEKRQKLELVVYPATASAQVSVTSGSHPAKDAQVALFPEEYDIEDPQSGVRTTRTDANGHVTFSNLVAGKYRLNSRDFLLYGFSGGGHFAHRMFLLHPRRLRAVSIGAPGLVTRIDPARRWWTGTADLPEKFGLTLDIEAMRHVPVQMVIGDKDTETWEITLDETSEWWAEGANDAGVTRLDRIAALKKNFEDHGIAVQLDYVPGAAHIGVAMFPAVRAFMGDVLGGKRTR